MTNAVGGALGCSSLANRTNLLEHSLEGVLQTGIWALPMVVQVGCGRSCISTLAEAIMPPPRYPSDLSDREWAILESRCCLVRRKAWSPAKMAPEARGERRLLPAARERVFVADAAPRVPTLADRLLPLLWK
jgi:hypothetical protein